MSNLNWLKLNDVRVKVERGQDQAAIARCLLNLYEAASARLNDEEDFDEIPGSLAHNLRSLAGCSLEEIERRLDAGHVEAEMMNGRWWRLRRNGRTKLWKTRPGDFRIPVKAGLKSCAYITPSNQHYYRLTEEAVGK